MKPQLNDTRPWVEKYRPKHLKDIVGNDHATDRLRKLAKRRHWPHLLFLGPPGTGKTTAAHALSEDTFGENAVKIELNASDERGINVIRSKVKEFANTISYTGAAFKVMILDECDNMTKDAQEALRRLMETSSKNCRFILIANDSDGLIEPIRDRCVEFFFQEIDEKIVVEALAEIAEKEDVDIDDKALEKIAQETGGSLRSAVNNLEMVSAETEGRVTLKDVEFYLQSPPYDRIGEIVRLAIEGKFFDALDVYWKVFYGMGRAKEFIGVITDDILNEEYGLEEAIHISKHLANVKILGNGLDYLQVMGFLARLAEKAN